MKLKRYKKNPILKPTKNKWENLAVTNPGVIYYKNKIHMLYRAIGNDPYSTSKLGYATSTDGFNFKRYNKPIFPLKEDYEKYGTEDPRITQIGNTLYITYVVLKNPANSGYALPQTAVASTKDFKKFKRHGKITSPGAEDKDVLLFPEKINKQHVFLHRPNLWTGKEYETIYPSIWISKSIRFKKLWSSELLLKPKYEWEMMKIGGGCPPIKTNKGWLLIYHGVECPIPLEEYIQQPSTCKITYSVGAALLDLKNPKKVIARLKEPILEAKKSYETEGPKKVVFPTGYVLQEEDLIIYYGSADKYVSIAYCNLQDLLNTFKIRS